MGGYGSPALAVKTGKGDVTEANRLWLHDTKNPQRVGSGVVVGDYIYILNEPGIAWCLEVKTGEKKWEQRLGGASSNWSSMVYADGRLYVPNRDGETFVLEANPEACKVLAENSVGKETDARLAGDFRRPDSSSARTRTCIASRPRNSERSSPVGY